jgi:gliding motility-associated-like protein
LIKIQHPILMKKSLPGIICTVFLSFLFCRAFAQSDQQFNAGATTTPINFPGTGCIYNWTNTNPSIGLPASGTGNIDSFTAVNTGNSPVTATITATPVAASGGFAYIASAGSNSVYVINTTTNNIIKIIPVGVQPYCLAVSPDGSKVYVANFQSQTVSVISTATQAVVATLAVGIGTYGIAVSPDGSKVYAANEVSNTVSVINTATNAVSSIAVGVDPTSVAISPDGSKIYVTSFNSGNVLVYNTTTGTLEATIPVNINPFALVISPDGSHVYVMNYGTVLVISTSTNTVTATIQVGDNVVAGAISADGSKLYISNNTGNTVSVYNTATNIDIGTIGVGRNPEGISLSPDGSSLYSVSGTDGTVWVINTTTNLLSKLINVGPGSVSIGNFVTGGTGCNGSPVTFTITVNPEIKSITATGTLVPLNTNYGTPSSSAVFTVSGSNLTAGVLVTPPSGFEVSTNDINFSGSVTIAANALPVVVYIRLAAATPVGDYSGNIVLSSAGVGNVTVATAKSTVTPDKLVITADNKSKIYGTENPLFTVSYSGFVNNETAAQLILQPVISTKATTTSPIGTYTVAPEGAEATNYTITYVSGILTITAPGIIVPNTFTPNGDGINDVWNIKYIENYPNCTVDIYNRYGEKLYSSIGYPIAWDGRYKGANLPMGTYYYIIDPKDGLKAVSGYVAIIR